MERIEGIISELMEIANELPDDVDSIQLKLIADSLKKAQAAIKSKSMSQPVCSVKRRYNGEEDHGYWWLHPSKGDLRFTKNPNDNELVTFFRYSTGTSGRWWHVKCELDWYRMRKECKALRAWCDKCST